jgi:hypothetical protein
MITHSDFIWAILRIRKDAENKAKAGDALAHDRAALAIAGLEYDVDPRTIPEAFREYRLKNSLT